MASEKDKVDYLLGLARFALEKSEESEVEEFVQRVESYLNSLEAWRQEVKRSKPFADGSSLSDIQREELRSFVKELERIHQQVMEKAEGAKDELGSQMGELHKKAAGLKKYVDRYPMRVSISGKREG